jgi:formate/nitrite transporter FocA (FNT family)
LLQVCELHPISETSIAEERDMADESKVADERVESGWVDSDEQVAAAESEADAAKSAGSEQKNLARPSAEDIYHQVAKNAREELKRSTVSLAISGLTGGIFMGLSALGVGIALAHLGGGPGAFVVSRIWNTLRLWATVLPSNVIGALAFASLAALTPAMPPEVVHAMAGLGVAAAHEPGSRVFWSGVVGGWIIATAAWLVSGSHSITGSVMVIWVLTFVVGLGNFAHCIATSGEILIAVLGGQLPWAAYPHWFGSAVAGNICGGVLMVTLLEYGQAVLTGATGEGEAIGSDGVAE